MPAILIYLLQVIACSALFAGCYWLFLRNGGFYQWNRGYILVSVALSVIIPLLEIPVTLTETIIPYYYMADTEALVVTMQPGMAKVPVIPDISVWDGLMIIAGLICLCLMIREILLFAGILRLKRKSEIMEFSGIRLFCTHDPSAPFTFFRNIFWKKDILPDTEEGRYMLRHELAHVRYGHSWDKMFMQLVCCIFWMNPFFLLFRHELGLVHEFEADRQSIGDGNVQGLSSLILCTLYPNHHHDFTSRFFQSPIKRRIIMISKNHSNKTFWRKLSVVPVLLIAVYLFAGRTEIRAEQSSITAEVTTVMQNPWVPHNQTEQPVIVVGYGSKELSAVAPPNDSDQPTVPESRKAPARGVYLYNDVDTKPVFPGTDGENSFRAYLAKNLRYPAKAQEKGLVGRLVVSYTIDENGNIVDAEAEVETYPELSEEVIRAVKSSSSKWTPAMHNGKNVPVKCYSFVEFRITKSAWSDSKPNESPEIGEIFTFVDNMPQFGGKVAEEGFRDYISQNTVYPAEAQQKGISGRILVEFIINEEGKLTNARIARGVDLLLDAEALRVIRSSPEWTPGKQRGKAVNVKYVFPVNFRLNDGKNSASQLGVSAEDNNDIFTFVEDMPLFDGKVAEEGFGNYITQNTIYPAEAQKNGTSGRVMVEFVINKEGELTNAKIARGVNPLLDDEALRVIRTSPKWKPGKQRGKAVDVKYVFPVNFRLSN